MDSDKSSELEGKTVPLAYMEMRDARNARIIKWLIIGWAVTIALSIGIASYERLQYDYTSSTTAECSGVYNIVDSEGNVVSSDISPEDVVRIMQELNIGDGTSDADSD